MARDIVSLTAVAAANAMREGDLTSEELTTACLDRIAERDGDVHAWVHIDRDHALAQARRADADRRSGKGVGPLHGVPVGVKDIIDTADMPSQYGSPIFAGNQPERDASCVTALREAGAILLGKTVTTELASLTPSVTRNPHNLAHTPGGSSSGSAAAVADGMVPLALGTQTGGSVIRPSAFCGIFGYKPTFGLIPRSGLPPQAHSLDTVGVMGRCVEDLALIGDALVRHDPGDPTSLDAARGGLRTTALQDPPLKPLFGFVKTHAWTDADPRTHEAFGELVDMLGGQVRDVQIEHTTERGSAAAITIQLVELAHHYGPLLDRAPDQVSPGLAGRIEEGRRIPASQYVAALLYRADADRAFREIFLNYSAVLTPAAPGPAPQGLETTGNPVFCNFWTYLGVPAVTIPALEVDGLPMGVQLVGGRRDDGRLLRTARWLADHIETG